ncbi:MAG: sugar-binding protein [candidate division WOR-3 bacterium]|nr:sugar-binding protein [candidate division WOR-3 bacterium]
MIGQIRKIGAFLLVVLLIGSIIGCGKKEKVEVKKRKVPTFILVPKSVGLPYWAEVERGMNDAAKELGVKAIFNGPPEAISSGQISIIEGAISRGIDGIGVSPNEPGALEGIIGRATERGIPVVTFDSDAPKSLRFSYIGTDNYEAGKVLGKKVVKIVGEKGKIAVLTGGLGARNLNRRIEGLKEVISSYPGIKIVTLQANNDDESLALSQAEAILQSHPDLSAFVGINAAAAPGAARALRTVNKKGTVKIVGFDTVPMTREFIRGGYIQGTVGQRPYLMGYVSIKVLYDIYMNERMKIPEEINTIDPNIDTGIIFVTAENIDKYFPKD